MIKIMLFSILLCSCAVSESYRYFKRQCANHCMVKQSNNVGSRVDFPDWLDPSFVKCICFAKDSNTKEFYIKR